MSFAPICRGPRRFLPHALPYRDYYNDDTRGMVARWYAREIELLDYSPERKARAV